MAQLNKESCDWRDNKTLAECMIYMLQNKIMCDVVFQTGREKSKISAHKYMLSSRSPVFHTMFEGSLPEQGEIDVPDVDTVTFQSLLRYIYSDEINISNDNVEEILYAADKYMIAGLKNECEKVLKTTANTEHATKALNTARIYNLTELERNSLTYIEENTKKCLSSRHALMLPRESLEIILRSDFLDCSETDICSYLLDWTINKCKSAKLELTGENLRNMAGAMVYLIRFPIVDMKYFSSEVSKSGLLNPSEIISIYQSHFGEKCSFFENKPRCPVHERATHELVRYESIMKPWNQGGDHALCFIADKNIWMKGVTIFYPINQSQSFSYDIPTYSVVIKLLDESDTEIISSTSKIKAVSGNASVNRICFSTAKFVTAGHKYTLRMTGLPNKTYFGQNCKDSVTGNGVTIKFENSPLCTSGTTTETGQFAGILFSV